MLKLNKHTPLTEYKNLNIQTSRYIQQMLGCKRLTGLFFFTAEYHNCLERQIIEKRCNERLAEELKLSTVQPGQKKVGLCVTLSVASDIHTVVPITSSLLTITLQSSVRTTLVCNDKIFNNTRL
jgi:hypothetical protein